MSLPTEADIAREIGEDVDPDAIHAARKTLRGALGRTHARRARRAARQARGFGALQPRRRRRPAGARCATARSPCMSTATSIEGLERAHRQLAEADNMTERFGALSAISTLPDAAREHALDAFGRALRRRSR